jgi:hypothetical protein
MSSADPVVAMRCADASEKAALLRLLASVTRPQLRWHLALMVPRLPFGLAQAKKVFS